MGGVRSDEGSPSLSPPAATATPAPTIAAHGLCTPSHARVHVRACMARYGPSDDSWEPEANLPAEMVAEFRQAKLAERLAAKAAREAEEKVAREARAARLAAEAAEAAELRDGVALIAALCACWQAQTLFA